MSVFFKNRLKIYSARKAVTCVEATSGSVGSTLFKSRIKSVEWDHNGKSGGGGGFLFRNILEKENLSKSSYLKSFVPKSCDLDSGLGIKSSL